MIREITCADIFRDPNAAQLLSEYAAECSIPAIGHINPQPDMYDAMEKMGIIKCFGVFEYDLLVGFACILTTVLPHYGVKIATVESLFVSHAWRKWGAGTALMRAIKQYAKESGCVGGFFSAPTGSQLEKLLDAEKDCTRTNAVFYWGLP